MRSTTFSFEIHKSYIYNCMYHINILLVLLRIVPDEYNDLNSLFQKITDNKFETRE